MTDLETQVRAAMAADPNYPLGERDAMKWAIAWRLTRDRSRIDVNAGADEVDGWMVGWFANAMASAPEAGKMIRGDEEETDRLTPSVRQVLMHAHDEVVQLRRALSVLEPKGEAYDALIAVINRLVPMQHSGAGIDVAWRIKGLLDAHEATKGTPMPG